MHFKEGFRIKSKQTDWLSNTSKDLAELLLYFFLCVSHPLPFTNRGGYIIFHMCYMAKGRSIHVRNTLIWQQPHHETIKRVWIWWRFSRPMEITQYFIVLKYLNCFPYIILIIFTTTLCDKPEAERNWLAQGHLEKSTELVWTRDISHSSHLIS